MEISDLLHEEKFFDSLCNELRGTSVCVCEDKLYAHFKNFHKLAFFFPAEKQIDN